MAKATKPAPKKLLNMSAVLRTGMERLDKAGWDLSTVPTAEIINTSRMTIRRKDKALTEKLRNAFNPTAAQVSIVKREFTGGSPTGERGRPSFEDLGHGEAEAEVAKPAKKATKPAKPAVVEVVAEVEVAEVEVAAA